MGIPAQLGCLTIALALCAVVGLEREYRQKSAGLRTHTLVGLGSALFMLVSKYGFFDVLGAHVTLDPSRVAAQIVSGIGFVGGGLIFVRRDAVRGLTTAASIWLVASIGAAAGAGLLVVACAVTIGYLLVVFVFPLATRLLPRSGEATAVLRLSYLDGRGLLRDIIHTCTELGFHVSNLDLLRPAEPDGAGTVGVLIELDGGGELDDLLPRLSDLSGVRQVDLADHAVSA